jgi:hypothetical protein
MDSKREDYSLVSKLVNFGALVILFMLLAYILKAWRSYKDGLSTAADEIIIPSEVSLTLTDKIPDTIFSEQEASELTEEPVEALTQIRIPEVPEQDIPEALETQIEASDKEDSVTAEIIQEAAVDPITSEAYCMKCKQKRTMQNVNKIVTKNGRNALEGICPVCGTRLFRFVSQ